VSAARDDLEADTKMPRRDSGAPEMGMSYFAPAIATCKGGCLT